MNTTDDVNANSEKLAAVVMRGAWMDGASAADMMPRWEDLALAAVKQAFQEALVGDYTALCWLVTEGRDWLAALGLSPWMFDRWETGDLAD